MKMGSTTGPLGRDCSAEEARSASTLVSTRQFVTEAGDLHLRMGPVPGWPARGGVERPRRVVRFARLMHRRVRAFGRPSAGAAYGGNLSLTWLLLSVVRYAHPVLPRWGASRNVAMLPCATVVVARLGPSGQEASSFPRRRPVESSSTAGTALSSSP